MWLLDCESLQAGRIHSPSVRSGDRGGNPGVQGRRVLQSAGYGMLIGPK